MTQYGFRRGSQWVKPPTRQAHLIPAAVRLTDDAAKAWQLSDLDVAIERQQLLRMCHGCSTEIRAIHQ
jgi:hypothetical protein